WFPRMCVYNDTEGWQNKQFQRIGEFALEFGDYEVEITVPEDHLVAATGSLQNTNSVLTSAQAKRLEEARKSFDKPVMIVTPDEAKANERNKATKTKTWKFKAENVRDFAFASSRKFIWDAQAVQLPTNKVLAMSFYPKEGLPTWSEESTKAIKNALEVYSEATFDYPYPVAISVNTSNIGMEFPMISFNGGRPVNGEMSEAAKSGMITTIVHEVGHNWFPMIVSS
ncbi:MAG: M1 family peptidase, partial [Flavobacteriaceae bacterium]|nr:M1 family peptidase [Flavobacteriaceae bacterium]